MRTARGRSQQTVPGPPKAKRPRRGEKGEPTASVMMRTTRSRSKTVEQHADQDAAMVLDKRWGTRTQPHSLIRQLQVVRGARIAP